MAYGSAAIGATELALFNADMPAVCGKNYALDASAIEWRQGGSFGGGSDETDSDGPTTYLVDSQDYLQSYPTTAVNTYLLINLGASNLGIVDTVALKNHNLYTEGVTSVTVEFDQNQNGNFAAVDTAATTNPQTTGSDKRIVELDLHHTGSDPRRYTDVQYLRIGISGGTPTPKIGEIFVGRRRQLKTRPEQGFDKSLWASHVKVFESDAGVDTVYEFHSKRARVAGSFRIHEDAYITDWETFYETDTAGATLPFWWAWEPSSAPTDALWCRFEQAAMVGPSEGYTERLFQLAGIEKGPNFLRVGVGL